MQDIAQKLSPYPSLSTVVDEVLRVWPEHRRYCESRFRNDEESFLARTEEFAALALANVGDSLERYVEDYRWMSERFLEEEMFFQREGRYRLSTFQEAYDEVYSDDEYMGRYMRGLLISQVIWDPHARAFDTFRQEFLPVLPGGSSYVEVGPGHGFFLYFASRAPNLARLEAWDVSAASILETREALKTLGVTREIALVQQDVMQAPTRVAEFEGAVISEVLEHLERPDLALRSLHAALKPGGRIFIHVPINSPAPDHIYLWRSSQEFSKFVENQGFRIDVSHDFPVTGYTLERAVKYNASISCVIIATKA